MKLGLWCVKPGTTLGALGVLAVLGFFAVPAQAQTVYKRVLPDGSIEYTDQRPNTPGGDKAVQVEPVQTYTPPPTSGFNPASGGSGDDSEQGGEGDYSVVSIETPAPDESVRENAGNVPVRVTLVPELQGGHEIVAILDGQEVGTSSSASLSLVDVNRGAHSLSVAVRGGDGRELARSGSVNFFVLRHRVSQTVQGADGEPVDTGDSGLSPVAGGPVTAPQTLPGGARFQPPTDSDGNVVPRPGGALRPAVTQPGGAVRTRTTN